MRVITIASQKGGVGKTTTVHALGTLLSQRGRRVLMIDLDPQASLTVACGVEMGETGMSEVMMGQKLLARVLWEVIPNLYLAPADTRLTQAELVMVGKMGRENILKRAIHALQGSMPADYCLIDCPPSLNLLTVNALTAAEWVMIPTRPEYLGARALQPMMDLIHQAQQELNPELKLLGILPTFFNPRLKHHTEVLAEWERAGLPLLPVQVGQTIRAAEAPLRQLSITDTAPSSKVAEAYRALLTMIEERAQ
ncbi:MAG: ParA family protein [Anaerolineae bacterium]|nr:ParA family protein [Anaerolineae bacterium]